MEYLKINILIPLAILISGFNWSFPIFKCKRDRETELLIQLDNIVDTCTRSHPLLYFISILLISISVFILLKEKRNEK